MICTAPDMQNIANVTAKLILEQILMLHYMVRMLLDQMKFITHPLTLRLGLVNLAAVIGISMTLTGIK